jgi:hypothetical protein
VPARPQLNFLSDKLFNKLRQSGISDADFTKDKKHQYYESLNNANFHYEHTLYPEIENLIPAKVLASFLIDNLHISETNAADISSESEGNNSAIFTIRSEYIIQTLSKLISTSHSLNSLKNQFTDGQKLMELHKLTLKLHGQACRNINYLAMLPKWLVSV